MASLGCLCPFRVGFYCLTSSWLPGRPRQHGSSFERGLCDCLSEHVAGHYFTFQVSSSASYRSREVALVLAHLSNVSTGFLLPQRIRRRLHVGCQNTG